MTTLIPKYDLMNGETTPTGAINRPINDKLGDFISVKDFGAIGDGTTNDTTAIQNAINTVTLGTATGSCIYFPKGTYLVSGLTITAPGTVNPTLGQNSIALKGDYAILKGSAACTKILSVAGTYNGTTGSFANGVRIEGLQLDMSLMANAATTYGLYITNSYNSVYQNITVISTPALAYSIYIDKRAYSSAFITCNAQTIGLFGNDSATDAITTINFYTCNANQINISQSSQISFWGCVVQGNNNLFNLYSVANISIIGGDYEGSAGYYLNCSYTGTGTQHGVNGITSMNNNITNGLTYITGVANSSNLSDLNRYSRVYVNGIPVTTLSTIAATTIYTFLGDPVSGSNVTQSVVLAIVNGDDGSNGFYDLIGIAYGVVFTINSTTIYGTPPTRTYSISTNTLKLARSAATAGNVRVTLLANNSSN